ncbi:efflux RND transporter permease subunit [Serratia ureilytica]
MDEVTGPIVAITSVLAAVFVPTAFLSGLQGEFYRQFALTIAISTLLSALNSLTLSPALAGMLLRPHPAKPRAPGPHWARHPQPLSGLSNAPDAARQCRKTRVRVRGMALAIYGGLLVLTFFSFQAVPPGFVPMQDKYYLVGIAQLPNSASLDRTDAVVKQDVEDHGGTRGGKRRGLSGLSINGFVNVPNAAVMFVMLDPFKDRATPCFWPPPP